ncbi:glycosyltransferase [Williamsia muralis]|uniref:glycosyltransferase n=1 Tax=Williamsia marianensis TaxID=85044 RepID=UPI0007884050|nr:glycosyltransferase [Williamsia muralis]
MRVVQVANFYGPRSGGLRTAVDQLGAGYCAAGHDVTLIVPGPLHTEEKLASGVVRITVPAPRVAFTGGYRVARMRPVVDVAAAMRPDAIEVSDRLTLRGLGQWARRRDVASTMISHERLDRMLGQVMPAQAARRLADVANRRTAQSYDTVVCTTDFAREEFDRIGATNVRRVPLGVDLRTFHPDRRDAGTRARWARTDQPLLVHCGRLSVEKHVDGSIDALGVLRDNGVDARLVIAGDGPMRGRLERRAAGLPVEFAGFITDQLALARLLASADVALAPGPHETFGLSALESLASGTPAVVSATSALAEVLDRECGFVAENSPEGFAHGIGDVLSRPEVPRREAARRRAEDFGWPRAVREMLAALAV